MDGASSRISVILDEEHALDRGRLAERTPAGPGAIARSLLPAVVSTATAVADVGRLTAPGHGRAR